VVKFKILLIEEDCRILAKSSSNFKKKNIFELLNFIYKFIKFLMAFTVFSIFEALLLFVNAAAILNE
jgi:hypothetical protein